MHVKKFEHGEIGTKNIASCRSNTTKPHSWPLPSACIIRRRVLAGKFFSFQPVLVLGGSEIWKVRISSLFLLRMRASFWSACAFFPARTLRSSLCYCYDRCRWGSVINLAFLMD